MNKIELRMINNEYVIINDGRKSSMTFSTKFRMMAVNKFKFVVKNSLIPIYVVVENEKGGVIFEKTINNLSEVDKIK